MSPPDPAQIPPLSWWSLNWGNIASVMGLILSTWVLLTAASAKRIVIQLKKQLSNRSVSKDLSEIREQLLIIKVIINDNNWTSAQLLFPHLLEKIKFIENRWSELIGEESKKSFVVLAEQLEVLSKQINKYKCRDPQPKEITLMNNTVVQLGLTLSCEIGRYEKQSEKIGGTHG